MGNPPFTDPSQTVGKIISEFLHYFRRPKCVIPMSIFATHNATF
jgi:hypothetical protein